MAWERVAECNPHHVHSGLITFVAPLLIPGSTRHASRPYPQSDSNRHCLAPHASASYPLGYAGKGDGLAAERLRS